MNKFYYLILSFLLVSGCSLDTKTGLWTDTVKLKSENKTVEKELFEKEEVFEKEFNTGLKIKLNKNFKKNSFINNLLNNNGTVHFDGKLEKVSKYKFSKIKQFDYFQPELLITKNNSLIFFNKKGTILNFADNKKLIWKKNVYSKVERKDNPVLYFASNEKVLIVADSIANYYAIDLINGNLIWKKNNIAPFNSQIKIFKDRFFVIDFENILRCYSLKDGKEIWNFKTEKSFIKSQQKLSLIVNNNKVVFINTLGDLSSVDIETGNLVWQVPTQSSTIYENYFTIKNSDLISAANSIYFSNNKNEFFAINEKNGVIRWKQNLNSNLRPTYVDGILFTVTLEGYLVAIDSRNGNIVRVTNILDKIKNVKKKNIKPEGFIATNDKIYISLNNGRLVEVDVISGKSVKIVKIDNEKISRPYVLNKKMYILKDKAILKLN